MIPLPPLPYPADALSPMMSERTVRTHHGKHQAKYVTVTNELAQAQGLSGLTLEEIVQTAAAAPDRKLFRNAAQAWNHAFFWNCMAPARRLPGGALGEAIGRAFGDLDGLRAAFLAEGGGHFGSGWVWLALEDSRLVVVSTHDADNLITRNLTPLLVCDVWEHAYYLDYTSDRGAFLGLWFDRLANWDFAERQFAAATGDGRAWTYPLEAETYVPPIHDQTAFEHALEEAGLLLETPPAPGSAHDARFGALLQRIADYEPEADVGTGRVSSDLEKRIRTAARQLRDAEPDSHWSPAVGGDVRPHSHA